MSKKILCALTVAGCCFSLAARAAKEITPSTTVGALAYLDFTRIANQQNGLDVAPTGTGFDAKRFYLSVDHKFDEVWSANLTTDAQYSSSSTAGSGGVIEVFVKKLYLQANLDDALVLHAGSYNSPWAPFVEGLYGYRWIEKTQTDRLGFANTADWGLNASGKLGATEVTYSASIVNGSGFKNPSRSKNVDFEGRLGWVALPGLTVAAGIYSGHLGQVTTANAHFDKNTATRVDLALAYTVAQWRVGAEYFTAKNYKTVNNAAAGVFGTSAVVAATAAGVVASDQAAGGSLWASYNFTAQLSVFGRYDTAKLSKDVQPDLKDTYFHMGVAYKPIKNVDIALVYKNEKVSNGSTGISSANANGSYTIGGANAAQDGKFDEIGIYMQVSF